MASPRSFDFIVVGAGTSGCAAAARLARHGTTLLLEAGGSDTGVQDGQDIGALIDKPDNLILSWSSPITRIYPTAPQPHLRGRSIGIHRGVVLGGSHAINGTIYVRGNRRDYDTWAQLGNDGWSFDEVLPYFAAAEHFDGRPLRYDRRDLAYHGTGGPVHVRPLPNPTPAALAFIEAARSLGHADSRPSWDFNGHRQDGAAGLYQVTVTADGRRASTASAYLGGLSPGRLTVMTRAQVTRVLMDKGRATGVECRRGHQVETYRAEREVVLCAGAFGSPKLLMLSGIGPAGALETAGIRPLVDLPGVGQNLHDHLMILLYHPTARDPGQSSYTAESGLFLNVSDASRAAAPNLQYHVLGRMPALPAALAQVLKLPADYFLICPTLCKAQSRGELRLRSRSPGVDPIIQPSYLECASDVDVLVKGMELAAELANAPSLRHFRGGAPRPFAVDGASFEHRPVPRGDAALREFVRATATTVWHPAGTCKMGRDRLAVVDPELRVHGVRGLRVADAAVIPIAPSGNINAACIMIGERCADLVAGRRRPALPVLPEPAIGAWVSPPETVGAPSVDPRELVERFGQAALALTTGGLRYWGRAAELWGRALSPMIEGLAGMAGGGAPGPAAARDALDEVRRGLRELAELPGEEVLRVQRELERVLSGAPSPEAPSSGAPASGPVEAGDEHWRRWRAKP